MNLKNVANWCPCCTSLTNWVTELARDQYLIFSSKMDNSNLFCQSDGGQKGQEVRLFSLLDETDTTESENGVICEFWADLTYTGKTSDEVAAGTNHSLQKFGHPTKQINGSTSDSGAGTPESYANACAKIGIWHQQGISDSCGLHDLQSVFRLAMQQFVGEGGLESRNAIQLSTRLDSTRLDSTRLDSTRLDSTRLDSTRLDSTRLDSTRLDSTRLDSTRLDSTRLDSLPLSRTIRRSDQAGCSWILFVN
jgi:hypothetical protein